MSTRLVALVLSSSLVFACGDDGDEVLPDANTIEIDATVVVIDAATIDAPVEDAAVTDATVSDGRVNDAAQPDGSVTLDAMACAGGCPTENASTTANVANTGGIVIQSLDFATSRVVLKNVTAGAKDISNWILCFGPPTYLSIPAATSVPDSGTLTLVLGDGPCGGLAGGEVCISGSYTLKNTEELGLYIDTNYAMPASIRAYVRWGTTDGSTSDARQVPAAGAGLWPANGMANEFVPICSTDDGLIATGDVTSAAGWTSANAPCF